MDVVALTRQAIRAAASLHLTSRVTVTRPVPPPNPLTGVVAGSPVSFSSDADTVKPARAARRNKAFVDASCVVYVAAADCTFPPLAGYTLQLAGKTYRIAVVERDLVGGTPVGYLIGGAA